MNKTIHGTEFEINEDTLTAKVRYPIEDVPLADQHIYPTTKNACLTLEKNNSPDKLKRFYIELDFWAKKYKIFKDTGIWIGGHSHSPEKAAIEKICEVLNTNRLSLKKLFKDEKFQTIIFQILNDLKLNDTQKINVIKEMENEDAS